jgi:hypothetical protein
MLGGFMSAEPEETDSQIKPSNPNSHQWISVAAYLKAERRGFKPGKELDDWLEAEFEYIQFQANLFLLHCEEDGGMSIIELQHLASAVGVAHAEQINSEEKLVRLIQNASQHRACFRFEKRMDCEELTCPWLAECQKLIAQWMR